MDSKEFVETRKILSRTQKELASLLGISLKAVCSYEQGWRTIPSHVERQLIFLLAKKQAKKNHSHTQNGNCWDVRNCPEETKLQCPAWEFNAGDMCWFVSGSICNNTALTTWDQKMAICKDCVVMYDMK
jgi:DNA-binding XRE family transcriptional regulator